MKEQEYIYGLHAVEEAIEAGRDIDKILIKKDLQSDAVATVLEKAQQAGIPLQRVPVQKLDGITRRNHQGVVALLSAVTYYRLDNLVPQLFENGENPFIVVLDGVTDVRNFGAIARTCECAGVSAIVIPERGSVSVNADAVKTSSGALNVLPVCREKSLTDALRYLAQCGFTTIATSDHNSQPYTEQDFTSPVAIVFGAEGSGVSPAVAAHCDRHVAIPQFGQINSLNVSVAAGIVIYEVVRQRLAQGQQVN